MSPATGWAADRHRKRNPLVSAALRPLVGELRLRPALVMNEFLNIITYDPDTTGRNGPHRAAKGIASHVF